MKKFLSGLIALFFCTFVFAMSFCDLVFANLRPQVVNLVGPSDHNQRTEQTSCEAIELKGVWFSYMDWMNLVETSRVNEIVDENRFKENVNKICDNLNSINVNNIYVHVRAFGDAFYPSKKVFKSKFLRNLNFDKFDPLKIFIEIANSHQIKVHGWINPMRVFMDKDLEYIPDDCKIKQWFEKSKRSDYYVGKNEHDCWVLNPCNDEVVNLIVDVEEELLKNYNLDGIHIDDYFFPSDIVKTNFDVEYFKKMKPDCDINCFRFKGTSNLVKKMHDKCHEIRPAAVFGAAIVGNFKVNADLFADVENWIKNDYVDYLMPEIYYSFENKYMPFEKCVDEWNKLQEKHKQKAKNVKFYVGLAAYRIGEKFDESKKYADVGWQKKDGSILKGQVLYSRKNFKNYGGYCLYDYKTLFDRNGERSKICFDEIENLSKIVNDFN